MLACYVIIKDKNRSADKMHTLKQAEAMTDSHLPESFECIKYTKTNQGHLITTVLTCIG